MSFDDDNLFDQIDNLIDKIPDSARSGAPKLKVHYEGNQTIIENMKQVLTNLKRDQDHAKKYLSSTLGLRSKFVDHQLVLNGKITKSKIITVFDNYFEQFVLCHKCGKPDTIMTILSKKKIEIHCLACGYIRNV